MVQVKDKEYLNGTDLRARARPRSCLHAHKSARDARRRAAARSRGRAGRTSCLRSSLVSAAETDSRRSSRCATRTKEVLGVGQVGARVHERAT